MPISRYLPPLLFRLLACQLPAATTTTTTKSVSPSSQPGLASGKLRNSAFCLSAHCTAAPSEPASSYASRISCTSCTFCTFCICQLESFVTCIFFPSFTTSLCIPFRPAHGNDAAAQLESEHIQAITRHSSIQHPSFDCYPPATYPARPISLPIHTRNHTIHIPLLLYPRSSRSQKGTPQLPTRLGPGPNPIQSNSIHPHQNRARFSLPPPRNWAR